MVYFLKYKLPVNTNNIYHPSFLYIHALIHARLFLHGIWPFFRPFHVINTFVDICIIFIIRNICRLTFIIYSFNVNKPSQHNSFNIWHITHHSIFLTRSLRITWRLYFVIHKSIYLSIIIFTRRYDPDVTSRCSISSGS